MIVCSSRIVGNRQSHCPAKHDPPLSVARKLVCAAPSALVRFASPASLHEYALSLSCTVASSVFFSHWSPVSSSVTVPSPLSRNRATSQGVPVPLALASSFVHAARYLPRHFNAFS